MMIRSRNMNFQRHTSTYKALSISLRTKESSNVVLWRNTIIHIKWFVQHILSSGLRTTDTLAVTLASSVLTTQRTHSHRGKWNTLCILPQRTKQGNWSADENTKPGSLNMNPNQTRRVIAEGYVKQSIQSSQLNKPFVSSPWNRPTAFNPYPTNVENRVSS